MSRVLLGGIAVVTLLYAAAYAPAARAQDVLFGTASRDGVYYQAGRAVCRLVDRSPAELNCEAIPTAGSEFNLINVAGAALELGLVQSDIHYRAVKRSGQFQFTDVSYANLRSVFSMHAEPFTVVARRDSGITRIDDLKGRRVNIGNPGSGQRATMELVMAAKHWTKADFQLAEELPADQQSLALCHGRIQAMVFTVGHPNTSVGRAANLCDARLVDVEGPVIDKLLSAHPYFARTTIPGGMYRGAPDPVRTFGVTATVVTAAEISETLVYSVVVAVFENIELLRRMHPALRNLEPQDMVRDGLTAPLHSGALRYYREQGLLPAQQ